MASTSPPADRIVTLDVIRGVAVMGIFSVNVVAMAMIMPAYFYPLTFGYESAWDGAMWAINFTLIEGKFRSLFSMLFGASALLVIDRAEASGRSPLVTHYARMAVLLGFGLAHLYLIWWGDILATYAVVGMVIYSARKLPADKLLVLSLILFALQYVPEVSNGAQRLSAQAAAVAPGASGEARDAWRERTAWLHPSAAELAADKAYHRSPLTYVEEMAGNRPAEAIQVLKALFLETLALMLLGMAAFRSGFLTGEWSDAQYRRAALAGLAIGGAAFAAMSVWVVASNFREGEALAAYFDFSGPFRPLMALGYAALLILLFRRPSALRERFAAVGRTAFTNYLGASIIGMLVFFETGLGLYGELSRAEAWLVVPVTWALMLLWAKPWLDRFAYGPLEWLWRSLSRGQIQPMRRHRPQAAAASA